MPYTNKNQANYGKFFGILGCAICSNSESSTVRWSSGGVHTCVKKKSAFKTQHPHTLNKFSIQISLHFVRELVKRIWLKNNSFSPCDHFINSSNLFFWLYIDTVKRKSMLDTLGTEGVNVSLSLPKIIERRSVTSHYHGTKISRSQQ